MARNSLLVNGFVVVRMWFALLRGFSLDQPCALYHPSPFWKAILTHAHNYITISPTSSFVVPALIWMLVSFRRDDWVSIAGRSSGKAS